MLADKHKVEKDQNALVRNQLAQLLQVEQKQKLQLQQNDSTIQLLQVGLKLYYFNHFLPPLVTVGLAVSNLIKFYFS